MSSELENAERLSHQVTSQSVEEALKVFKQAEESLSMAQGELEFCDKKTQDLLHEIELCDQTYHERAHAATQLRDVRQRRRVAKDIIDTVTPLFEWCKAQTGAVNQLKQCLGAMRRAEERAEGRVYCRRTSEPGENFIIETKKK